ncbi:MAG: PorT family protein [Paludibacteraceae bacterium]|nr:PorT family protein [Paludibacteraceae bacterium]
MKRGLIIVITILATLGAKAQMNNPYVDDKIVHFGFSLGMNFMTYGITDSEEIINGEVYHARVSHLMPGFQVGFITDVRLCRYLNLRFTPGLEFSSRTITYKTESGKEVKSPDFGNTVDVLSIPITVPLYLKFSAQREKNYRPYVIAGGGFSYNVSRDRDKPVLNKPWDYFVSVGVGVDLYLRWFKLCPEIKYQIGFSDLITPVSDRPELAKHNQFYTSSIKRMTTRMLTISFNFE